ncbi:hypothetical protein scyTo_0023277 [Scyliorhinus torazame]|uniref:Uncharacterized protein n=1 Tax=Scyliorhinus torazame TaxID=75743 RepID=A0A401Q7G4_SCYTO|nr:hypothetical protein [Scyliorhinus torazame]
MARKSEVLASSIGHLLDMKLVKLQNIWDDVGIQEDKRLERMASAKKCIEVFLKKRSMEILFGASGQRSWF